MWIQERFCKISFLSFTLFSSIFFDDMRTNGNTTGYFWLRLGWRLKPENVNTERINCNSAIACTSLCFSDSSCNIASWGPDGRCQMSSYYAIYYGGNNNTVNLYLEPAEGWMATPKTVRLENSVYPVVFYTRKIGFTFLEGAQLCQAMNTRVASPAELLEARDAGFQACKCGWLSDESRGFVMLRFYTSCWYRFITGIDDCSHLNPTEGVYCKLP